MRVKIKRLHDDVTLPKHQHPGDAGLDLFSREDYTLKPGERHLFRLGFTMALPERTVGLVWDRSGMAKHGIRSLAGVIDQGYRGEYCVLLVNLGQEPYEIKTGDRIAQLLVQPIHSIEIEEVDDLDVTKRGGGGFGSSGK